MSLSRDLEAMIEREREAGRGDPEHEAASWTAKLVQIDRKRAGYQDLAAERLMTKEELGVKLRALEETRKTAEEEPTALASRRERLAMPWSRQGSNS